MNHNRKHRFTALLLALCTMLPLTACGGDESTETTSTDTTVSAETETVGETAIPDNLPADLDFGGRTFTVMIGSPNEQGDFIAGKEEITGEIVFDAVRQRDLTVEERLNIDMQYDVHKDVDGSSINTFVSNLLLAGDSTHDVFSGHQWGMVKLILNGGIVPTEELEHLEITQPWWWKEYMDEMTLNGSDHYFLVGDYFLHALRSARVTIYNKDLYTKLFGNGEDLYQIVLDGTWTIDKMTELAEAAFADLNNNGETDIDDQLGFCAYATAASTDPFVYGSDIQFIERTSDGGIEFQMISEDAVTLCEKLVKFFWQPGSYTGITSDEQQAATFASGNVLFMGNATFAFVERMRDMEDAFGIIPCPKFDEEQESYRTLVHDGGYIGAVSGSSVNLDIAGAVLEALCAETYRSVTPVYYETALKIKYTRDDMSARMIDLMHDTLMTNFIYDYNYVLNDIGLVYRQLITNKSTDYVSTVEGKLASATLKLEELAAAFAGGK